MNHYIELRTQVAENIENSVPEENRGTQVIANSQVDEQDSVKARHLQLRQQEKVLQDQRRKLRNQRKLEDQAWKILREERQKETAIFQMLSSNEKRAKRIEKEAKDRIWSEKKHVRSQQLKQRKVEDQTYRIERDQVRQQKGQLPPIRDWIAVLVIVDNLTRQCLGVPMFVAGANITAKMVCDGFAALLPPNLQYLITDRDKRFRACVVESLAEHRCFKQVLLAPHRPQSNGIAERFVKTLKGHLVDYSWQSPRELNELLLSFENYYNNRPHQGKELKGLSPNEFASRF